MKRLLLLVGGLLLGVGAGAQECRTANFFLNFDVEDTTVVYGLVSGDGGSPFGGSIRGLAFIQTSGSSTTVTSDNVGDNAFAELAVGDSILVTDSAGVVTRRQITAKASSDSVTVDAAVDFTTATAFRWLKATTSATLGWLDISAYGSRTITVEYNQGDLGRLDVIVECRGSYTGSSAVQVFPTCTTGSCGTYQAYTTVGIASRTSIAIPEPFGACRVGVKYATSDASDAGANREQITAGFEGCLGR